MKTTKHFQLLPRYFKIIGWGIVFLASFYSISMALTIIFCHYEVWSKIIIFNPPVKIGMYLEEYNYNVFLIGVLILAFTREKIEDERIQAYRIKAMSLSLIFAALFVIIQPLVKNLILDLPHETQSAQLVMIFSMIFYLGIFRIMRG